MAFDDHLLELGGSGIELRVAADGDADLIQRIVGLAAFWRDGDVPQQLPAELSKYVDGWKRPNDQAVVAFKGIEFVGGAMVRQFGPADGAYGYVRADYPELAIGVEAGHRRRGLGVLLIAALKAKVIAGGGRGISLSVEPDNGARVLYEKLGFDTVEDRGHDVLMMWELGGGSVA